MKFNEKIKYCNISFFEVIFFIIIFGVLVNLTPQRIDVYEISEKYSLMRWNNHQSIIGSNKKIVQNLVFCVNVATFFEISYIIDVIFGNISRPLKYYYNFY